MIIPKEIAGHIVDDLRARYLDGERVSALVRYLKRLNIGTTLMEKYLEEAFCLSRELDLAHIPTDDRGDLAEKTLGPLINETKAVWSSAPPYPDLMRRRDRQTFRTLARLTGNVFIVKAANPYAGFYIGKEGYRPCPSRLMGAARLTAPNPGLVAADPKNTRLIEILRIETPHKTYEQYVDDLKSAGFTVGNESDGYLIRDAAKTAFYPGYYLHGVYKISNGLSAWTGHDGDRLRAELNKRMGEDLIQYGPHDGWDLRTELGGRGPIAGPQLPVIFFLPNGNADVRFEADSMARFYSLLKVDWDALYPEPETAVALGTVG